MRALSQGRIQPWQYHIARAGRDTVISLERKAIIAANLNGVMTKVKTMAADFETKATAAGVPNDITETAIFREAMERLEDVNLDDILSRQFDEFMGIENADAALGPNPFKMDEALDAQINEIADMVQTTIDDHAFVLSKLDPDVRKNWIDGTIPHLLTPEGNQLMANIGAVTGIRDDGGAGSQLLAIILTATDSGGKLESRIGASITARGGTGGTGKVAAHRLIDEGAILIDKGRLAGVEDNVRRTLSQGNVDTEAIVESKLSVTQMNDLLEPEVRTLAGCVKR